LFALEENRKKKTQSRRRGDEGAQEAEITICNVLFCSIINRRTGKC